MRRFTAVLVMTVLVGSGTLADAGSAGAAASRPGSFCSTARGVADDFADFDPTAFSDSEYLTRVERVWKKLGKQAPAALETPLRRINAFYKSLGDAGDDPTDPDNAGEFAEQAVKVRKALKKVFTYLSSKCELEL